MQDSRGPEAVEKPEIQSIVEISYLQSQSSVTLVQEKCRAQSLFPAESDKENSQVL